MLPQCLLIQSMQPAGQEVTRCLPWFAQIVVDFSATWCGPCRLISPYFDELSAQYPGIIFLKVDVDAVDVRSLPSVQLFRGHVAGFEQQMSAFWLLQLVERKEPHRLLRGVGRFHRGGHQRYADFPGTLSPNEYSFCAASTVCLQLSGAACIPLSGQQNSNQSKLSHGWQVWKGGEKVEELVGAAKDKLKEMIEKHAAAPVPA